MKEFNRLLDIITQLLGPKGCAWDQAQTLESIRTHVIEEAYEVVDAINSKETKKIVEELGDLFLNVAFLCKLGEKEKQFTTEMVLKSINEKLIRRHPHVFGSAKASTPAEVESQWEKIKKEEGNEQEIPKSLPALPRAYKVAKRRKEKLKKERTKDPEMQIAQALFTIVEEAAEKKVDPEVALLHFLSKMDEQ